jgi:enterochelin esterase-like enzyme
MKCIWMLVVVAALAGCGGGGSDSPGPESNPDASGGQVIQSSMRSSAVEFTYPIEVFLPQSYAADSALLPVIYVTESDAPYGAGGSGSVSAGVSRFETFKRVVQRRGSRVILVGIGGTARRNADFLLPTARNYLNFMTNELAPQIERQYRADSKRRALSGLSHGGYFVIAALVLQATGGTLAFSHDLSTDSSMGEHPTPAAFLEFEKQLDAAARPVPATLLLAGAAPNGTTNGLMVKALYDQMASHAHPGLVLHHASFETTHVGADVPAFEEALARYFP